VHGPRGVRRRDQPGAGCLRTGGVAFLADDGRAALPRALAGRPVAPGRAGIALAGSPAEWRPGGAGRGSPGRTVSLAGAAARAGRFPGRPPRDAEPAAGGHAGPVPDSEAAPGAVAVNGQPAVRAAVLRAGGDEPTPAGAGAA